MKHFRDFFVCMKSFCQCSLEKQIYKSLLNENVFDFIFNENSLKKCFENSLKIFRAVCMKGSEFYRLAPEYIFPVPLNDVLSAYLWCIENYVDRNIETVA
ncbi:MAG: alpha/beta hydrolase [Holosporaceae bacterium]|jgi:hypothetical protein|nr:alpha/beta hydrolase [Holosporaceae bacterium]